MAADDNQLPPEGDSDAELPRRGASAQFEVAATVAAEVATVAATSNCALAPRRGNSASMSPSGGSWLSSAAIYLFAPWLD